MIKRIKYFSVCLSILLAACSGQPVNPTVYSYQYNEALAYPVKHPKAIIAPINYIKPSRHFLSKYSDDVDAQLAEYLQEHGYKLRSTRSFNRQWKKLQRDYGDLIDENTGKYNKNFSSALEVTIDKVFASDPKLQYIIFTDLILSPVNYGDSLTRTVQFHGVERKVKVQGIGNGVNENFNWNKKLDASSLSIHVINRNRQLVLHNIGGIQVTQALELQNNTGKFKRRKDLLRNTKEIQEAIRLSLHPLIKMKKYPIPAEGK